MAATKPTKKQAAARAKRAQEESWLLSGVLVFAGLSVAFMILVVMKYM